MMGTKHKKEKKVQADALQVRPYNSYFLPG